MARAKPKVCARLPRGCRGQRTWTIFALFLGHKQRVESQVEEPGLKPSTMWDTSTAGQGLAYYYDITPGPWFLFKIFIWGLVWWLIRLIICSAGVPYEAPVGVLAHPLEAQFRNLQSRKAMGAGSGPWTPASTWKTRLLTLDWLSSSLGSHLVNESPKEEVHVSFCKICLSDKNKFQILFEGQSGSSHLLVHFPHAHNGHSWAWTPNSELGMQCWPHMLVAGTQLLESAPSHDVYSLRKQESRTGTGNTPE